MTYLRAARVTMAPRLRDQLNSNGTDITSLPSAGEMPYNIICLVKGPFHNPNMLFLWLTSVDIHKTSYF